MKIIIAGFYGAGNTGDEAILVGMIESLKDFAKDKKIEITVLTLNAQKLLNFHEINTIHQPYCDIKTLIFKTMRAIRYTDIVLIGGGGILQDVSSPMFINHFSLITLVSKLVCKPVMFYAVGVGPVKGKLGKLLIRLVGNQVDLIVVRDKESKKELVNMGIAESLVLVTVDPAITLRVAKSERVGEILTNEGIDSRNLLKIGICPRSLTEYVTSSKEEEVKNIIAKTADFMIEKYGIMITFIPMFLSKGYQNDVDVSIEIMKKMQNDAKLIRGRYTPQEIKGIIGQMDLIIGIRFHSLIFAAGMSTPFVGIVYDPKVYHFLKLIGEEKSAIHYDHVDYLLSKVEQLWISRENKMKELKCKVIKLEELSKYNAEKAIKLKQSNQRQFMRLLLALFVLIIGITLYRISYLLKVIGKKTRAILTKLRQ